MKKIVIAPNAYKGTMTAVKAANILAAAVHDVFEKAEIIEKPMADGGDGTALVVAECTGGEVFWADAPDPFGVLRHVSYARLGDSHTYVIDAASASGHALISPEKMDVWKATSEGTGILCEKAMNRGAEKIILGVGGTAFIDGGIGIGTALGVRFLDRNGLPVSPGGRGLLQVEKVDMEKVTARAREIEWTLALDVDNPLLGPLGAASVYGPQKGASEEDVLMLEKGLAKLAAVVGKQTLQELKTLKGFGAGGGMSIVMKGLFGAQMQSGGELTARIIGLEDALHGADLVVTGEGCIDAQTSQGKAPAVVAGMASMMGVPVVAIAGKMGAGVEKLYKAGFNHIITAGDNTVPKDGAVAEKELFFGAKRFFSALKKKQFFKGAG